MHITIQRTGGFTAIPVTKTVDVAAMPPNEATQLRQMVEGADFFNLPSTIASTPQPDRFTYQISVEQDGKRHSVTFGETAMPPGIKPLVDFLMKSAH
ncbi:MAG: protealysin inhibitor emfourin [Methylobacter sp.]